MSDSPTLPSDQTPQFSDLPNPNSVAAEDEDDPSHKSPIEETLKNPDQEPQPVEQKSNVLVDVDEQEQKQQECEEIDQEEEEEIEDEEGINMPHSPLPQSSTSKLNNNKNVTISTVRRNKKRKKGFSSSTQIAKQRKIDALSKSFNPIPFIPDKIFNFSKHEHNLRKLGLWEFAHLQFDTDLRVDLLVQLIADSTPKGRFPYVNERRIKVSRADLARALKLPVKKLPADSEAPTFSAEFISFLEDFVSSWMLLQEGDVWVTPDEIVNWLKMIREGQPHKVDWAGLIWFMVDKELAQGTGLKDCYYASHLQQLIKDQRKNLLEINTVVEEVMVGNDEEGGDTEMMDARESSLGEERLQDQCIQLGLDKKPDDEIAQKDGDDDVVERADDAKLAKIEGETSKLNEIVDGLDKEKNESNVASMECLFEGGEMESNDNDECAENVNNSRGTSVDDMVHFGSERNWLNGVNDEGQHVMQRCSNMSGLKMSTVDARHDGDCEDVEDEVGEDDEQGFKFMEESTPAMNEMSSRNLLQVIETGHLPYTSQELGGQSSLGFLPSKAENDVMLDSTSLFDHVVKREIDHEHDISHQALDQNHKRMRFGHWDHKPPDSETCMDELLQWAQKLKVAQVTEREEACQQVNMAQLYSHEKDNEVMQWRCKFDELQRKFHTEVSRRDRELHLMNNVIDGYRRALKDTQKAFSEYRKQYQIPDEPIYKDAGSGGVVKSIMELEKERIKQEEENMRICYLQKHEAFELKAHFESLFQDHNKKVMVLVERLRNAAKKVEEVLRYHSSKCKMSKNVAMSEEVQSEAQEPEKDDLAKHKMSENVSMSEEDQSEELEVPKQDVVEPKISDSVPIRRGSG